MAYTYDEILQTLNDIGPEQFMLRGTPQTEDDFNQMFTIITGVDETGTAIESSDPADFGITWADLISAIPTVKIDDLRRERNKLLEKTDWTQLPDVPQATRDAWSTYRQALRDITETYSNLEDVVWPTKP